MSRSRRNHALALAIAAALAIPLAACSDTPSQSDAESSACDSLAGVRSALQGLGDLNSDSTVEEAQAARETLDSSVQQLRESASELSTADSAALEAGAAAVSAAVSGITSSDTLQGAADQVKASTAALETAVQEIGDGLQCE